MPSPFAKHFASLKLTPSPFNTREWARVDAKIRTGAFFSATIEDEHLLEGLRTLCQAGINEGWQESMFVRLAKQWMADNGYSPRIKRIGIPDKFIAQGTVNELHKLCGMDVDSIAAMLTSQW